MAAKRNSEYWRDRFEEIAKIQISKADSAEEELVKEYEKAILSIQKDIEAFYGRYATTNQISYVDARKQLTPSELKGFKITLEEFKSKALDNADGQWTKELDSEYIKSRVNRLEAIKFQIRSNIELLKQKQQQIIEEAMADTYSDTYYRSMFEVSKGVGYQVSFSKLNDEAINNAVYTKWLDGNNFSDRIWNDKTKLLREINTNLTQGFIRGDSPDKMIKNLSSRMNVSKNRSAALVQTETAHISNQAAFDTYHELNVDEYEVLGTLDLHTCAECGDLDGEHFKTNQREDGVNAPPFHTDCRCTTIPYFDNNAGMRAARDPRTGKTIYVSTDTTFNQWKKSLDEQYGEGFYDAERKKITNAAADQDQYQKYKTIFKKDFPNSFDNFQDLKYNNNEKWNDFKAQKQDRLNSMDFKDMGPLKETLGNLEVRLWYKTQNAMIPDIIDKTQTLEKQAMEAFSLRNLNRDYARKLMANLEDRKQLELEEPNTTFDELLKHKYDKYELEGDAAYQDIIRSSATTNQKYDRKAGIK